MINNKKKRLRLITQSPDKDEDVEDNNKGNKTEWVLSYNKFDFDCYQNLLYIVSDIFIIFFFCNYNEINKS